MKREREKKITRLHIILFVLGLIILILALVWLSVMCDQCSEIDWNNFVSLVW